MDLQQQQQEFVTFVAALPADLEPDLAQPHVLAAFVAAREAGHQLDHLVYDAQASVRGGAGVGLLVTRLRTLATSPPSARRQTPPDHRTVTRMPPPHAFVADAEGWFCQVCQLPASNRTHQGFQPIPYTSTGVAGATTLTTDQVAERMALLERIRVERLTPDQAEEAMSELIDDQRGDLSP